MMNIKNYIRAQSLEEAYALNQKRRNRIIGGMLWLKMTSLNTDTAIDLCDLGLDTIEESDAEFRIGASVTLRQLELHSGLNHYTQNALARSVQDIVGVQFRNLATVGGSIFGRFGFSDVLTVFLVMDCFVELYKGGIIPLAQFAAMPRDNDILVRLIVKKTPAVFSYHAMRAARTDFPVITCAAAHIGGEYRAAIGARPARAILVPGADAIFKDGLSEESIAEFADFAAKTVPTGSNLRGSAAYRTHLIRVLTARAFTEVLEHGN